ncbi:metallophosphoesterase [bacterium]|nr:MAG: metallophosphoesterase [bacterium]
MKIGVISDTHIPDKSKHVPQAVLDVFKQVDIVVHAGDMVGLEVIAELEAVCVKVFAVAGNMDSQAVKNKYPVKELFDVKGFKIGIMHGWGAPLNLIDVLKTAFKEDNPDIIIFGHSHKPMNELIGTTLFFNPESATDAAAGDNSYGIIEINDRKENSGSPFAKIIKI